MPQTTQSRRNAYSFKEGLAMMVAQDVGVDPYLAAEAGDDARAVLAALRKAKAAHGAERAKHIKDAQAELRKLSPSRHGALVNALSAKLLALQGRGGDTEIAHVTPGEVVIPRSLQTPALMQQIAEHAAARGIDPAQLSVGHRANKRNPRTGQREFAIEPGKRYLSSFAIDESRHSPIEEMVIIARNSPHDFINLYRKGEFVFSDPSVTTESVAYIGDGYCSKTERQRYDENNNSIAQLNLHIAVLKEIERSKREQSLQSKNPEEVWQLDLQIRDLQSQVSRQASILRDIQAEQQGLEPQCGEKEA